MNADKKTQPSECFWRRPIVRLGNRIWLASVCLTHPGVFPFSHGSLSILRREQSRFGFVLQREPPGSTLCVWRLKLNEDRSPAAPLWYMDMCLKCLPVVLRRGHTRQLSQFYKMGERLLGYVARGAMSVVQAASLIEQIGRDRPIQDHYFLIFQCAECRWEFQWNMDTDHGRG
jgi:hypothetical protein